MAFPTIPTGGRVLTTNQADTSGTRTFPSLSSLTKNSGDLLIAIIVCYQSSGSSGAIFSSWGGGFTEFSDQMTTSGSTMAIGLAYKWSDGTETGTFTVTQAATVTGHASLALLSIPGAHASTSPEANTIVNGTSSAANPGSFNPAGWDAEDTLWIALAASGMTSATSTWTGTGTTAPTNYGSRVDSNTTDNSTVGQTELAVAFRQLNAASEDVGTAGVDTSNARNSAVVIAVRPVASVSVTSTDAAAGAGDASNLTATITVGGTGAATATGDAQPAASGVDVMAGASAGTGEAYEAVFQAASTIEATADVATAAADAATPSLSIVTNAGIATGTSDAPGSAPSIGAFAGAGAVAGAASNLTATTEWSLDVATATGAIQPSAAGLDVDAGGSSAIGSAQTPEVALAGTVDIAAATGAAQVPSSAVTWVLDAAAVTATAIGDTADIVVNAGAAIATGIAQDAIVTSAVILEVDAGMAAATGEAKGPSPSVGVNAGAAAAIGAAYSPAFSATILAVAGVAAASGVAQDGIVSTASELEVDAGVAQALGAVSNLGVMVAASPDAAMLTATAHAPIGGGKPLPAHVDAAISQSPAPAVTLTPTGIYAGVARYGTMSASVRPLDESLVEVDD